ncbi:PrpF family protein [Pelagibius litoralis]|uniref:PrpF family protein n=1 Tax=Pelagibius litoralis TaxID=374515 RepID=A0A967KCP2_9PROT|nr:PrpF domain-containing protein [Pelagibius litoralis]NIA70979.1 PrpF family protein [Pelagibius litoralis]
MKQRTIKAVFMRGGTSKGLFMHRSDLPEDASMRDALILAAMGSPDPFERQLDGMGGGISSLSKIMIVDRSTRPGVDIEYVFGQVSVDEAVIHYQGNCGNLTSAVAAFAVNEGLVNPKDGLVKLRMLSLNTGTIVGATLGVKESEAVVEGNFVVDGVSGSGALIQLDFLNPAGAVCGKLLPTGMPVDVLEVQGVGGVSTTIMDAGTLVVFVNAEALRLSGRERPTEIQADKPMMAKLEAIRVEAAVRIGAARCTSRVSHLSPSKLSISLVASTEGQAAAESETIRHNEADIYVQSISMGVPHRAIPVGVAMCTAVAAKVEGTVVNHLIRRNVDGRTIQIAHPAGLCPVDAVVSNTDGWHVDSIAASRTARRLMSGLVYAPESRVCLPL